MKPRKFRTLDGSDKLRTYADEIARLVPLESLDPRAFLADQSVDQHTCDLVLALALAFNDVKGLFFRKLFTHAAGAR